MPRFGNISAAVICGCLLLLAILPCRSDGLPSFTEDFQTNLNRWQVAAAGKQPLLLVPDPETPGNRCAYSGPPGTMRVMKITFPLPLVGRLEVRFYDDMATAKQQIAAVTAADGELLGIICPGGKFYQARVGQRYTNLPVARSKGWHRFAWECDGHRTVAYIDGRQVFANEHLGHIAALSLGSYWDASTGWYDDVIAVSRPPADPGPFCEAEDAFSQSGTGKAAVQIVPKAGASGAVLSRWDRPGQTVDWALGARQTGSALLLMKYATAEKEAVRAVKIGATETTWKLAGTGGWDRWGYAGLRVPVAAGANILRMECKSGGLNVDWLALVPAAADAGSYGAALDTWVRRRPWLIAAVRQTESTAKETGVSVHPKTLEEEDPVVLPDETELRRRVKTEEDSLLAAQAEVLAAERKQLAGAYRAQPEAALGAETELSCECYHRLLRYVRLTDPLFHDWPYAAGCRYHKVDDHNEMAVRQNATVALGYATLLLGSYDANIAGVPREKVEADLVSLLRYIAITHKANFLPTGDGEAWGDQWQSAFWAGIAGQAAWLCWDRLPDDVRIMIARMVIYEANRFNTRPPDSGEWSDTKAEENAWNSEVVALAACMFPHHPNHALWQERAIVWMINSFTTAADLKETKIVDGRPVKDRVTAVCIHPDFTLENHDRVHPDYLATGSLLLRNALLYRAAGMPIPESTFYHVPETYEVVKRLTATNGSCFYVNGQDWWPHRHDVPLLLSALMSVLRQDREAAFLERSDLDFFARMHARFADGRAWDRREYNYANAEEEMIARYAELYLAHRMFGDGPAPVSRDEFLRSETGAHVYEIGGFVTHRTPEKFASFAWVHGAMGLVYPSDDTWFTSPSERGMVGRIKCQGIEDDTPKVEEHHAEGGDGFRFTARISRCGGAVEQSVAVVSLPGAPVLYLERLVARKPVTVNEVATGLAPILNEDAPGISPNFRVATFAGGSAKIVGASNEPAELLQWKSGWANIDGKLGAVTSHGEIAYHAGHAYQRARLEQELYGNYRTGIGPVAAGKQISAFAMAFVPNQTPEQTAAERIDFHDAGDGLLTVCFDGVTVVANLGTSAGTIAAAGSRQSLQPLGIAVLR